MEHHETLNAAEDFVYRVCKRSFLSLWSYANPQGKDPSKELCDILVVCQPDIIIFSVKDIKMTDSGNTEVDRERWKKRAIEASCRQIYGAERIIKTASHVIRKDGSLGLPLSQDVAWRVHRVAVALGSEGKVPIEFGDFGKGFVHVFDEEVFSIILQELDTIEDFIAYLAVKENLYETGVATFFEGAEEDLLAFYLHHARSFPQGPDLIILDAGLWKGFIRKDEYTRKKQADQVSYVWDTLVEALCESQPASIEPGPSLTEMDLALRTMARETRFSRRILGKALREFLLAAKAKHIRSRMTKSLADIAYVFVHCYHGEDIKFRQAELGHRCFIARGTMQNCKTVIGVSTEEWKEGCYSTLVYLQKDNWTEEDEVHMQTVRNELGFFKTPLSKPIHHEDEYPIASDIFSIRPDRKVGRNEPCPCGSGKKYKHCHLSSVKVAKCS